MYSLLKEIKHNYCHSCEVGSASIQIGYQSSGTCLDYVYDKLNVPYSFAWEIYTGEVQSPEIEKLKKRGNNLMKNQSLSDKEHEIINKIRPSNFLQVEDQETMVVNILFKKTFTNRNRFFASKSYSHYENQICLKLFNPVDKETHNYIKQNWTNVYLFLNRL